MNSFADTLFRVLFNWVRSLVEGIWAAVVSGSLSGFFSWLGDHWLAVVLSLILICTILDFLVWLARWRPYLVWRTRLRRLLRRLRGEQENPQAFEQGYDDGVALDMQEEPAPEWQPSPAPIPPPVLPEEFYAPAPPPAEEPPFMPEAPVSPHFFPASQEYAPELPGQTPAAAPRRRRSDKHEKRKASWHERLTADTDEENGMLDGLPPAIDREQAFHEPVYPQPDARYAAWERPENNNQMNG